MGLAASVSYNSSRSGGGSLPAPHRPFSHLGTVVGGISPEDGSRSDEEDEDDGLPTIRESSRSSSNVNLLTPRVSLGGKALAGLEDSPSSAAGDISPKNGSLPSSGPSGLSLMLNRTVPSPKKKEKKVRKRDVAGTDRLASGASGALGVLDFPEEGEEKVGVDSAGMCGDLVCAGRGVDVVCSSRYGFVGCFIANRPTGDEGYASPFKSIRSSLQSRIVTRHPRTHRNRTHASPFRHLGKPPPPRHTFTRETPHVTRLTAKTTPGIPQRTGKRPFRVRVTSQSDMARCRTTSVCRTRQVVAGDNLGMFVECVGWG